MLNYLQNKTFKKHHAEKEHEGHHSKGKERHESPAPDANPVLSSVDEQFLERIVSNEDPAVPVLDLPREQDQDTSDAAGHHGHTVIKGGHLEFIPDPDEEEPKHQEGKEEHSHKHKNRWSFANPFGAKKDKSADQQVVLKESELKGPSPAVKEENDITEVLDNLNLAAKNNRVFSLSKESQAIVQRFNLILKDIVNGVPTAYNDLVQLLDSQQGQLEKTYSDLPPWLQKFVRALPKKLTTSMAPELLATAAEAQGMSGKQAGGMKFAAKQAGLRMPSLQDMVTKPGAVAGILKSIMNFLKLRWPAFMGTSVLWSIGLFVLLLVFWYCHKRGKEVRLEKERLAAGGADDSHRFEELDDDSESDVSATASSHKHRHLPGPSAIKGNHRSE